MKKPAFTFLELLIAISIFAVGMISVIQIFPLNRRYLAQSGQTTQATFVAQEQIENLRGIPYASITTGAYEALHTVGTASSDPLNQFQRKTDVSYVDPTNGWAATNVDKGLKLIKVTVQWNEINVPRQYILTTYVYNK